jgi:hypothetical protein
LPAPRHRVDRSDDTLAAILRGFRLSPPPVDRSPQRLRADRVWRLDGKLAHHRERVSVLADRANTTISGDVVLDGHRGLL